MIVRDGWVLAAHRRRPVGWEFPGGKVETGETPAAAIERECLEELAVTVTATRPLGESTDSRITLQLWLVTVSAGEPAAGDDHDALRWVDAAALDGLDWLPIDRELLPVVGPLLAR